MANDDFKYWALNPFQKENDNSYLIEGEIRTAKKVTVFGATFVGFPLKHIAKFKNLPDETNKRIRIIRNSDSVELLEVSRIQSPSSGQFRADYDNLNLDLTERVDDISTSWIQVNTVEEDEEFTVDYWGYGLAFLPENIAEFLVGQSVPGSFTVEENLNVEGSILAGSLTTDLVQSDLIESNEIQANEISGYGSESLKIFNLANGVNPSDAANIEDLQNLELGLEADLKNEKWEASDSGVGVSVVVFLPSPGTWFFTIISNGNLTVTNGTTINGVTNGITTSGITLTPSSVPFYYNLRGFRLFK